MKRHAVRLDTLDDDTERSTGDAAHSGRRGGGPRSRLVEAIAVLLLARPMRAAEIAEVLGYSSRYVSSYLSYWRTRGLFDYENGYWTLTDAGEEYARNIVEREMNTRVSQYTALARSILGSQPGGLAENVTQAMNNKRRGRARVQSGGSQPFIAGKTFSVDNKRQGPSPALCARALLENLELDEDERTVLEALLQHYVKWGSTYTYLDHMEKELDADRGWLLAVLRALQAKRIVYLYTDRRLGMRVGLARRLRSFLEECHA